VTVLGAVSELERTVITERVRAGLENAKAKGVKLGKPKKPLNRELLMNLINQKMSYRDMSKLLGVSPSTISRELRSVSITTT
jgi:putative DNA-invertase from lambdoid prophage Rac